MNTNSSDGEFIEEDDLVRHIVCSNDVESLKRLIKKCSLNNRDNTNCTALHFAVEWQKINAFDYLITLENINLESYNSLGQTPLTLACQHENIYFAKRLIQNGADVNQCTIDSTSPLFCAIRRNSLEIVKLLLEKGADVNYTSLGPFNIYRQTPLDFACRNNNYDAIHMLLYYGAVVSMVHYSALINFMTWTSLDCLETFLLHYLDEINKADLDFVSMIIKRKFRLFPVVLESITEVDCDRGELNCDVYDVEQLVALLKKFPGFRDFFFAYQFPKEFPVLRFDLQEKAPFERFTKLIFKLAEESLFSNFLETEPGVITRVVEYYKEFKMCKDELAEFILILVSYGLPVYFTDFLYIHSYFGNGFLVKLLLHNTMEIAVFRLPKPWAFLSLDLMGVLIYMPNFDFNYDIAKSPPEFMSGIKFEFLSPVTAFRYFANSKFLKFVSKLYPTNRGIKLLLRKPRFPSLMELSRNVFQKFIYSKCEISGQKSGKYYDIVERLPVENNCKRILTFDIQLYSL